MTNYSRSVLKSNGLRHLKNLPVKFDFSPIDTSANIVKKLPPQRCISNHLSSRFSTSPTNAPRSLSRAKAGTHSAFGERLHTTAHTPKQGCFGRGRYYYSRSVPHALEALRGRVSERQTLPFLDLGRGCSRRTQKAFGTAMRLCASLFRGVAAPLGCVIFFRFCRNYGFHTLCLGSFRVFKARGGITTLGAFHTVRKPCVAGV